MFDIQFTIQSQIYMNIFSFMYIYTHNIMYLLKSKTQEKTITFELNQFNNRDYTYTWTLTHY